MKPSLRSRHARLLALCGLSAAVHLALLHWFVVHRPPHVVASDAGPAGPLLVRLAPAPVEAGVGAAVARPAPAASPAAAPVPTAQRPHTASAEMAAATQPGPQQAAAAIPIPTADRSRAASVEAAALSPPAPTRTQTQAPASLPTATEPAEAIPATTGTAPAPPTPPARPVPPSPGAVDPAPSGASSPPPLARVARRYRTDVPPARRLAYAIVPDGAVLHPDDAPAAYLDWRPDGDRYALEMDGVLGRLSSSGAIGDEGLAPVRAGERVGEREVTVRFEADGGRVVLDDGTAAPGAAGVQDRASALLRLAGIGLGGPAQMRGAIAVAVADAAGVRVDSYEVIGREDVVTGRGKVAAWHLAQRAAPGQARLELWLAPSYDWLPVRLRLVRPDGGGASQVMLRADPPSAP